MMIAIKIIIIEILVTLMVEYAMFGEEVGPTREHCVGSFSVGLLHNFYESKKTK